MTRDEVLKGLGELASRHGNTMPVWNYTQVLRAAIAYMTPPTTEEIEAAREWLHCLVGHKHTALKALDALAREPGLETRLNELEEGVPRLVDANHALHNIETLLMEEKAMDAARIAALEAQAIESDRNHKQVIAEQAVNIAALEAEVAEGRRIVFGPARDRIAVLEARLARVREVVSIARTHGHLSAKLVPQSAMRELLDSIAALAADAGPAEQYVHADCIASGHRCGPGCAVDVMADLPAKPDAGPAGSGWKCACGCDGGGAHHAIPTALPTDITIPGDKP